MSIAILGLSSGSERQAAEQLAAILAPQLNQQSRLVIIVGAKCFGFEVQDIDLLVLGTFGSGIPITDGNENEIRLVNLALVIEVKDQSHDRVQIEAQHVKVRYRSGWEDATEKAFKQAKTVPSFLREHIQQSPWFESVVWLRNYTGRIPSAAMNVLGADPSAQVFFEAIHRLRPPKESAGSLYISFSKNSVINEIQNATKFFTQTITPTPIDRKRCEEISRKLIDDQKYVERLGSQLLIFRGRAGSGKTVHLLRLCNDLYQSGSRVLFLTYNKALVADIRRLLVLTGITNGMERGVHITTAHKFFIDMLTAWGYWRKHDDTLVFDERYAAEKLLLLDLLSGQDPTSLLQETFVQNTPHVFGWDFVVVDEAQDWPEDERDLLFSTFGRERLVIADGVDQLVRRDVPCDWLVGSKKRQIVSLKKALRMGSSLCRFITAFAREIGEEWTQDSNDDFRVGEVTILEGEYTRRFHESTMKRHSEAGNQPVDALFCTTSKNGGATHDLPELLTGWGFPVWDGTQSETRDTFPTSSDQYRIVHYRSCRGLEGWTVVCLNFDTYYEDCLRLARLTKPTELISPEEHATRMAASQILIPLTRSMKHIVLQIARRGRMYEVCKKLHEEFPDVVSWVNPSEMGD
jgi:hypothetical protein